MHKNQNLCNYLFFNCLFYIAVDTLACVVSKGRVIGELRIGKNLLGNGIGQLRYFTRTSREALSKDTKSD
jgi:hypothetical protein